MQIINGKSGWVEVICGPMFSGKSEELIKRIRRAQIARRRVQIFKHGSDSGAVHCENSLSIVLGMFSI